MSDGVEAGGGAGYSFTKLAPKVIDCYANLGKCVLKAAEDSGALEKN